MPTTRRRLLAALVAVVAGLVLVVAPPVEAARSTRVVDSGWWWRVQAGLLVEVPIPPNVEEGQLMVQSTVEGEQAIAAVSGEIEDGRTNPVLTLDVSDTGDGGGAAAVLLACQSGSAWIGEDGGRWDARPTADCSTSVTGIASDDGAQWTFPLGTLQFGDRFSVVIVPGQLADSDVPPTFTLVFDEPTDASIQTVAGTPPPPTVPVTDAPTPTAPPTTAGSSGFTPPPTAAPVVPSPPTTVLPVQPVLEPEGQGLTDSAPVVTGAQELAAGQIAAPEPRTLARIVGGLVLLAGLAGLAVSRRSPFVAATATVDAPVVGGLARFRTSRTAEPDPVS